MPSRASRRSSPRPSTTKTQSPAISTAKETIPGKSSVWSEPPLQDAKPSFEDHGGVPFGVLEDMQALGTRPGAKVKARAKEATKKSMLSKSAPGMASDAQNTPESTPTLEASATATTEPPTTLLDQPLLVVDDEKDQDYMPRKIKKSHKSRLSRSAAKPTSSPAPAMESPAPATATTSASVVIPSSPAPTPRPSSRRPSVPDAPLPDAQSRIPNLKAIVDAAVERSLEVGNPSLGFALQELYNESLHDPRLASLLAGILEQTASPEETKEFREHITRHKKRYKSREESASNTVKKPEPAVNGSKKPHSPRKSAPPPPELVPRQSIEAPAQLPAPKISLRVNFSKKSSTTKQSSSKTKKNDAKSGSQHLSRRASSSSLSSLTSNEDDGHEDRMDLDLDLDLSNEGSNVTRMQETHVAQSTDLRDTAVNDSTTNLAVTPLLNGSSLKRSSAEAEMDERDKILASKKQKLDQTLYRDGSTEESHIRPELSSYRPVKEIIVPPVQLFPNGEPVGNREESPLTEVSISPPPGKGHTKKAKTKQSPTKKHNVNYGGEPNGSGGKGSPTGYDGESDNQDFCAACNGSGFLLCCDGCDRAFHFTCLDPPLSQEASELQEPWFCFKCVGKRAQPQKQQRGLFSSLLTNLDKRNPTAFSLPQNLREYFDGISTGKDGRFLDVVINKTRSRVGYDELPDNFKTKDAKGQVILCNFCGLSSMGRREIITCDQCGAHWHLDCLDPPLANPPHRDQWGKKVRDWLCPLHVEHELREVEVARLAARQVQRDRRIHMRKPRNAKTIDTSLNRGFVNNGVIEVLNEDSDDDSDFYEIEAAGVVYRLPENGIKLDFIDRVKKSRKHDDPSLRPNKKARAEPRPSQLSQDNFARRSFLEQQTALSLIQFSNEQKDLNLSSDQVENLLGALIAEAPADVVQQMLEAEKTSSGSTSTTTTTTTTNGTKEVVVQDPEKQRKLLELLQTLIGRKLGTISE